MGKRNIDHDTTFETTIHKKRKTESVAVEASPPAAADIVDGVILTDLCSKKWRCGKPIGEFEIFACKSDDSCAKLTSITCRQRKFRRNFPGIR